MCALGLSVTTPLRLKARAPSKIRALNSYRQTPRKSAADFRPAVDRRAGMCPGEFPSAVLVIAKYPRFAYR